ncbi:hypothetical protein FBZ90_12312 [Nitrospirillum pindoramense]|uniref:Uncharacterized protein n=2 Tax=Azospirillaceae TaxID=2829815 RepID=A0A560GKW6_9PROT|nr:hypothetical protein FBZ90_12312 [Nitrospirillum amazonense]
MFRHFPGIFLILLILMPFMAECKTLQTSYIIPPVSEDPDTADAAKWVQEASSDCGDNIICLSARMSLLNSAMGTLMALPCAQTGNCSKEEDDVKSRAESEFIKLKRSILNENTIINSDILLERNYNNNRLNYIINKWMSAILKKCDAGERTCILGRLWLMTQADQAVRNVAPCGGKSSSACVSDRFRAINDIDSKLNEMKKTIISQVKWPVSKIWGQTASYDAWILVQHMDNDYLYQKSVLAFLLSQPCLPSQERQDVAYIIDRVELAQNKKQLYGTQGKCINGRWEQFPTENNDSLNVRRQELGMETIEIYSKKASSICGQ